LRRQAQGSEQRGDWVEACRCYDEAYRADRSRVDCREGYKRCLRQFHLHRRHRDSGYREIVAKLTPDQAAGVYEDVLKLVSAVYFDRDKSDFNTLFQHGLGELRLALDDDSFRRTYFAGIRTEVLKAFKQRLDDWNDHKVSTPSEAREEVVSVARTAEE